MPLNAVCQWPRLTPQPLANTPYQPLCFLAPTSPFCPVPLPMRHLLASALLLSSALLSACSSPTSTTHTAANTAVSDASATTSASAPAESSEPQTAMPDISSPEAALKAALEQNILYMGPFTPYTGSQARIYGSTANGCIAGAASLSDKGEDFQLQRWGRNRHYAHPLMLQYLADLRARSAQFDLELSAHAPLVRVGLADI